MSFLTIPVLLASLSAPQADATLERVFKAGDTERYAVSVTINEDSGATIEVSADVIATVKKSLDGGRAEIGRSIEKLIFKRDGEPVEMPKPDQRLDNFDKYGMPESMSVEGPEVVYVIQAFCGYTPNAKLTPGGTFEIKWKAADDSVSITGKGTLTEIVEIEGAKYAKLTNKCTVSPADDHAGEVTFTSWLAVTSGKLLKADGKAVIEGTTVTFKVSKSPTK